MKPEFNFHHCHPSLGGYRNASSLSPHNVDLQADVSSLCLKVISVPLKVNSPQDRVDGALAASVLTSSLKT